MVGPISEQNSGINLNTLLVVYCIFSMLSLIVIGWMGHWSIIPMILTIVIFGLNLWAWIWSVQLIFNEASGLKSSKIVQFFASLKFFIFIGSILLIFLAFGWVPVLVGNTIIVLSVLLTTLIFAIHQPQDVSDE